MPSLKPECGCLQEREPNRTPRGAEDVLRVSTNPHEKQYQKKKEVQKEKNEEKSFQQPGEETQFLNDLSKFPKRSAGKVGFVPGNSLLIPDQICSAAYLSHCQPCSSNCTGGSSPRLHLPFSSNGAPAKSRAHLKAVMGFSQHRGSYNSSHQNDVPGQERDWEDCLLPSSPQRSPLWEWLADGINHPKSLDKSSSAGCFTPSKKLRRE